MYSHEALAASIETGYHNCLGINGSCQCDIFQESISDPFEILLLLHHDIKKNAELGTHNCCTQFCHEVFHWRHSQTSVCVCVSLTFWNAMISWFHGSIPNLSTFFSIQKTTMSISVSIRGFHPRSIRNPKSLVSQTRRYHQVHHLQHPVCLWAGLSLNRCWVKRTCLILKKHDFS